MFLSKIADEKMIKEVLSEELKNRQEQLIKLHFDVLFHLQKYPNLDKRITRLRAERDLLRIEKGQSVSRKEKLLKIERELNQLEVASNKLNQFQEAIEWNKELTQLLQYVIKNPKKLYEAEQSSKKNRRSTKK